MNNLFALYRSWMYLQKESTHLSCVHVLSPDLAATRWHGAEVHPAPVLIYSVNLHIRIKTSPALFHDLFPGEAVIISPGTLHQCIEPRHAGVYYKQGFMGEESDFKLIDHEKVYTGFTDPDASLDKIQEIMEEPDDEDRRLLLIAFLKNVNDYGIEAAEEIHPAADRMRSFICMNAHRDIRIKDIIAVSGLADAQAFAVYKNCFGVTPLQYLLRRRVQMAKVYLGLGMDHKSVVSTCGFHSRRQMNRAFHQFAGTSPRGWLRALKAKNETAVSMQLLYH